MATRKNNTTVVESTRPNPDQPVSMTNLPSPLKAEEPISKMYTDADMDLLAEASLLLGFDRQLPMLTVRQTLRKLGMKILNVKTVQTYKNQKVDHAAKVTMPQMFGKTWDREYDLPRWRTDDISNYTGFIPPDVLRQAIQIKKENPAMEFLVESLAIGEKRDPDPFMIAKFGDNRLYFAVWEEPDFEKIENIIDEGDNEEEDY